MAQTSQSSITAAAEVLQKNVSVFARQTRKRQFWSLRVRMKLANTVFISRTVSVHLSIKLCAAPRHVWRVLIHVVRLRRCNTPHVIVIAVNTSGYVFELERMSWPVNLLRLHQRVSTTLPLEGRPDHHGRHASIHCMEEICPGGPVLFRRHCGPQPSTCSATVSHRFSSSHRMSSMPRRYSKFFRLLFSWVVKDPETGMHLCLLRINWEVEAERNVRVWFHEHGDVGRAVGAKGQRKIAGRSSTIRIAIVLSKCLEVSPSASMWMTHFLPPRFGRRQPGAV